MGNKFTKSGSWKTTTLGVTQFVSAISLALLYTLDDDPQTNADWALVSTALFTMVAFFFARDNDKTSENVGAK